MAKVHTIVAPNHCVMTEEQMANETGISYASIQRTVTDLSVCESAKFVQYILMEGQAQIRNVMAAELFE